MEATSPFLNGKESDIVQMFCDFATTKTEPSDGRLPCTPLDTVVREMAFKFGRADIVIFHVDGSASVIEAKDGTRGYHHVVSGIGQAGLYAAQLAMNKGTLTKVRKCLLWTSTGSILQDALIEDVCTQANAIPLPWAPLRVHIAVRAILRQEA